MKFQVSPLFSLRCSHQLTHHSQLLFTITLTTLFSLISGLPTSASTTDFEAVNQLTKRSYLRCHSGLAASVCQTKYGTSCDMSGEIFTPSYPEDGSSCTSRNCYCSRW
ncbi:hypothetical protein BGZ57DRAFT_236589 [Hyaloscypha finlandica]|nr:hypothetical protein BGZ57DRAFT_236589 [Hyaloscypha finlandica]